MVYVSKPKPSKGYVSYFILGGWVFSVAYLMIITIIMFKSTNPIFGPALLALVDPSIVFIVFFSFAGLVIHAAYNTEYRIDDGKLCMKFGYLRKGSVPLDEIRGIEKVDFIRGVWLPGFHNRSYCNRFKNGVGIITERSKIWRFQNSGGTITEKITIWVSPEDSERFISELGLKTSN